MDFTLETLIVIVSISFRNGYIDYVSLFNLVTAYLGLQ